jgi:hypothetical protein
MSKLLNKMSLAEAIIQAIKREHLRPIRFMPRIPLTPVPTAASVAPMMPPKEKRFQCAICLDDIKLGGVILPCVHKYHRHCIDRWRISSGQRTCPECRTEY